MPTDTEQGVFPKYHISKCDGSRIDASACYFVLRLDEDPAARAAMRVYATECGNEQLAEDIDRCLDWLDNTPVCTCGGGRDSDEICMFHDGGLFSHPVWTYQG